MTFSRRPDLAHRLTFLSTCGIALVALLLLALPPVPAHAASTPVSVWLTTADQKNLLTKQTNAPTFTTGKSTASKTITVDDNVTYQQMTGFGSALTDSSSWLIANKLSTANRNAVMAKLYSPTSGIGMSLTRQPMWGSDSNHSNTSGSYDDNGGHADDASLSHFSIAHDNAYVIPVLQQAKALNPNFKILATTWVKGLPNWIESDNNSKDLDPNCTSKTTIYPQYYAQYAEYFVKFIQAYKNAGLPIWAITPMNEPDCAQYSVTLSASAENTLIKNYLGPDLKGSGVLILGYDHNWNDPGYANTLLNDATTRSYLSGIAWHMYGGIPSEMSAEHSKYPTLQQYMTEYSPSLNESWNSLSTYGEQIDVTSERNWSKSMVMFVTAADTKGNEGEGSCYQVQYGGCGGLVSIDESTGKYTLTPSYYALGQTSKFVLPGAYRISSNTFGDMSKFGSNSSLDDVAYKNPDGSKALVVVNNTSASSTFGVQWDGQYFNYTLPSKAIATFTWSGSSSTTPTPTPTQGTTYYTLVNHNSGKVLDVTGGSKSAGAAIVQDTATGALSQEWSEVSTSSGYIELVNRGSGYVLDTPNSSTTQGQNLDQQPYGGGSNQQWKLVNGSGGYVTIVSRSDGQLADVYHASQAQGAAVIQWASNGGNNQQWQLTAV